MTIGARNSTRHTQVFDIDNALIPQPRFLDRYAGAIGDEAAITALDDAQTVHGRSGLECKLTVEV